jgi:mono/diheme cytochrome c family protein
MAATDKPYRSQRTLDIVFGVSCILLLLSTVWMFAQDYFREFKGIQREFRDVEEAVAERTMLDKLPPSDNMTKIHELEQQIEATENKVKALKEENRKTVPALQSNKAKADAAQQAAKADFDSVSSLFDIAVDKAGEAASESERTRLEAHVAAARKLVQEQRARLDSAILEMDAANLNLEEALRDQTKTERELADLHDQLKKLTGDFDRFAKTAALKRWKTGDWVRALPVLDGFASPVKIQQYTLNDLPIDYAFKYVTRYDRCTTCHLAIDRGNFDADTLRGLKSVPEDMPKRLDQARELLFEREKRGEKLGFDPSDLPKEVWKVDLTDAQIKQYAAHPHLHLFADSNSPHPAEKFGCSICHGGQGSATEFGLAAHTPNDARQKHEWEHGPFHWEPSHFWDWPMLPARFVESSCLKCHYQVTDLANAAAVSSARDGKIVADGPGAKVLKGYNLLRENGCFGCHEIAGMKGGRSVGPDLRLEPNPALDALTPAERNELLADATNPPGTLRKVGPSLYRLTEKTNQEWTRKWIAAPRTFRPDTKMPHFYGLSNNNKEALEGTSQEEFPNAEIHAITYYLFSESQKYLNGSDTFRQALLSRKKELEELQANNLISDAQKKELVLVHRRLEYVTPPAPLTDARITGSDGNPVAVPPLPAVDKRGEQVEAGRNLFTIKGCLACHTHKDAPVPGQQTFAPNLSRLAAKIAPEGGDANAKRRWLIQWILNPNIHFPRTRMPITHLTPDEAAAIAAWLLGIKVDDWDQPEVATPKSETLAELVKVYLIKAPAMTKAEVRNILERQPDGITYRGLSEESVKTLAYDADERALKGPITDDQLKWYIGKKSISRLGCFGCHNVPGFEYAKPIGTPLNDWGKKDPERLAFEDIEAYVKDHYTFVDSMTDKDGHGPKAENGKEPYEKFFAEAIEHHTRDGFLNQKLMEPRSYDFNRLRAWDDRLRMPQFKFARGPVQPLEGESAEQAETRAEAEAREAVMTFVLGLVAEPIPLKYVYAPNSDRLAEAKGLHVLEKFNCAGCHQLKAGVYDFKANADVIEKLTETYNSAKARFPSEHRFLDHNAWVGPPQPTPDRVSMQGMPTTSAEEGQLVVRLTRALHFNVNANEAGDIPAADFVILPEAALIGSGAPYGGVLANLLPNYLIDKKAPNVTDDPTARSALPPPLLREGEKVQPGWLFQFLRNPSKIRPVVVLRMPRFNMSDDEAMTLVNYFAAVDRLGNPNIGLTAPYLMVPQKEDNYWREKSEEYVKRLQAKPDELKKRIDALKPLWEQAKIPAAAAEKNWKEGDAYAGDAYRLVANENICLNCHQVGTLTPKQLLGPPLALAPERLRPDWSLRWIASPQRMMVYPQGKHPMPENFPAGDPPKPEFLGTVMQQVTGVRDVFMDLPRVLEMPENRYYRPPTGDRK